MSPILMIVLVIIGCLGILIIRQLYVYTRDWCYLIAMAWCIIFLLSVIGSKVLSGSPLLDSADNFMWGAGILMLAYIVVRDNWPYPFIKEIELLERADKAYENGNYSQGLRISRQARAKSPRNPYALYSLGHVLNKLEKYNEAIRHLKFGHELAPKLPEILIELGYAYRMKGNYGKAIPAFEKALSIDAKNKDALDQLAACKSK